MSKTLHCGPLSSNVLLCTLLLLATSLCPAFVHGNTDALCADIEHAQTIYHEGRYFEAKNYLEAALQRYPKSSTIPELVFTQIALIDLIYASQVLQFRFMVCEVGVAICYE